MAKANVLDFLYKERKSPLEFNFDMLTAPPLLSLLTYQDIYELNRIARSVKLVGKIDEKYRMIDSIMNHRGFVKLHAGTNRVVYRCIEDQRFVIKVAIDRVGLNDNPAEFRNQFLLKPFVTKVFDVSTCGTVGLFERVDPIMSREEFASVADDVFALITKFFVGRYVLEDIGAWFFMNWGVRRNGAGLVLLDFPYVYELDGNKLYCNAPIDPFHRDIKCGGELDYDDGFNNLICTRCGKRYNARDLAKAEKDQLIIVGGKKTMKVKVKVGSQVILDSSKQKVAKVIEPAPVVEKSTMKVQKPKDAIFHKAEEKVVNEPVVHEEEKVVEELIPHEDEVKEVVQQEFKLDEITEPEEETIEENTEEVSETENEEIVESDVVNEPKTELDKRLDEMDDELNKLEQELDEMDDEYDEEEYEQFLSNRERSKIRKTKKQNRQTNDFSEF